MDQPPPPGFEPTPPTRYRDEPPTDRFETTGGYQPEDYRMPPEDSRDRRDFQENPPQRPRKEEPVKDKYEGRSRERAHSRSRHRLTPSPEVNKPRERNSSADRYVEDIFIICFITNDMIMFIFYEGTLGSQGQVKMGKNLLLRVLILREKENTKVQSERKVIADPKKN